MVETFQSKAARNSLFDVDFTGIRFVAGESRGVCLRMRQERGLLDVKGPERARARLGALASASSTFFANCWPRQLQTIEIPSLLLQLYHHLSERLKIAMAENAPPASGNSASNDASRGMPYYERLRRDLRESLNKKRMIDTQLVCKGPEHTLTWTDRKFIAST